MMSDQETIPCRFCADPTTYLGTQMCDPCYQLQSCLVHALRTKRAKVVPMMIKLIQKGEL